PLAMASAQMSFKAPDIAPEFLLSLATWQSVKGENVPMPAPRHTLIEPPRAHEAEDQGAEAKLEGAPSALSSAHADADKYASPRTPRRARGGIRRTPGASRPDGPSSAPALADGDKIAAIEEPSLQQSVARRVGAVCCKEGWCETMSALAPPPFP